MAPGPDPPDENSNNRFHLLSDYVTTAPKKHKLDDFPTLQSPTPAINSNPKYVIISSSDPKKPLSDWSPFLLQKSIESVSKEVNSITQLRDGNLLILARNQRVADKFLKTKSLGVIYPVSCYLHPSLNSVKGVIYAPCLIKVPEKEIVHELKDQGVIDVYKFTKLGDDGKSRSPTGKIVLTFNLYRLPPTIDVAWYKCKVEHYFPNPMRCKICQKLGHTSKRCNGNPSCPQCSLPPHDNVTCTRTLCINCSGEHPSTDSKCPRYIQTKEILKIKTKNYCSLKEARRLYLTNISSSSIINPKSYASVTSNISSKSKETISQPSSKEPNLITSTNKPINLPSPSETTSNYNRIELPTSSSIKPIASTKIVEHSSNLSSSASFTPSSSISTVSPPRNKQNNSSFQPKSPLSNLTQQLINSNNYYIPSDSLDKISMES